MAKHKSVEARRLTELGQGLYAWGKVMHGWMFNSHVSVADCSAKAAMREIALMEDTYENSKLLREAAYCCGLPEREADGLKGVVVSLLRYERGVMCDELAEYVRGTWPDIEELADMACDADDVADRRVTSCFSVVVAICWLCGWIRTRLKLLPCRALTWITRRLVLPWL